MSVDAQHHRYSASGSEGWLNCSGKLTMEEGIPDKSSSFADEGSAAHYLASVCLSNNEITEDYLGQTIHCWSLEGERDGQSFASESLPENAVIRSSWEVTREMADYIQGYVDYVRKHAEGKDMYVEQRVHFGDAIGLPGAFGTADSFIIEPDGSRLHNIDLKYGHGEVSAVENTQQFLYDAGIISDYEMLYDFDNLRTITQTIYQPRIDNISTWTCAKSDLDAFLERAKAAVQRSEEAKALFSTPNLQFENFDEWAKEYLHPSDKGCKWCKARQNLICPKVNEENAATFFAPATADDLSDLDAPLALPEPSFNAELDNAIAKIPSLPMDTVAKLFQAIPKLEDWIKAIETQMLSRLQDGETHPDWKLVRGKAPGRKWGNEAEVEAAMKGMRLKIDEMYDKSIISPAEAEKRLKKERPKLWKKLESMVVRGEGRITVAHGSDKRDAIVVEKALDMLPDLSEEDGGDAQTEAPIEKELLDVVDGDGLYKVSGAGGEFFILEVKSLGITPEEIYTSAQSVIDQFDGLI